MKNIVKFEPSEHNVAVLTALAALDIALSQRQIIEILAEAEIIEPLVGLDILSTLEAQRLVASASLGGTRHFKITPLGKDNLAKFSHILPAQIIANINAVATEILSGTHEMQKIYTQIDPLSAEGEFLFKCGVWDKNEPLVEIRLKSADCAQIDAMSAYFRQHFPEFYEKVLGLFK